MERNVRSVRATAGQAVDKRFAQSRRAVSVAVFVQVSISGKELTSLNGMGRARRAPEMCRQGYHIGKLQKY